MTVFLLVLALIGAFLLIYALVLRPWLKKQAWALGFFAWIDPIELALFKKSETILVGRLLWVSSLLVTGYDAAAAFIPNLDLTPITTRLFDWLNVPPDMRGLSISAFVGIIGLMINRLRKQVTKPLDLVAVSDAKVTTAGAAAMAQADAANNQAVQVVNEAKT
jgi:hypothetical protein